MKLVALTILLANLIIRSRSDFMDQLGEDETILKLCSGREMSLADASQKKLSRNISQESMQKLQVA
jgi:hypothetical protein